MTWGSSENEKSDLDFHDLIQYMPENREVTQLETFLMDVEEQVNGWPLEPGEHGYDDRPRYQGDVLIPDIKVWDDAVQECLSRHAKPLGEDCWKAFWKKTTQWRNLIYGLGEPDPTDEQAAEAFRRPLLLWMGTFEPRSTRSSVSALTRGASTISSSKSQTETSNMSTQFST